MDEGVQLMTDLDVYQPPQLEQYHAGLVMTPEQAKALDDQVRACTRAVLREGVDYGTTPGTGDDTKTLKKPGAEKLLQWFGLAYTMHCLDTERDDEGRKQGATYRCTVVKRLSDGRTAEVATCEGYAGYDEAKFYKSAEQAQADAEAKERYWAAKDKRVANPNKWKYLGEYKAPWNTVIKMSQKRALVGAAIVATAAGGLFSQEDDDERDPVADDGSTWTEQALEAVWTLTDKAELDKLYVAAVHAARDGLCNHKQKDWVQNAVRKRQEKLKTATPADVEDLAGHAAGPGRDAASTAKIGAIWTVLSTVYKFGKDEKDQARAVCSHIAKRPLTSTKDMTKDEASTVLDTLASWQDTAEANGEQPREFLIELMATAENGGGDE
jgi:hypothetical protein